MVEHTGGIIKKLKQAIPDNAPNWNPLPDCRSPVELAMLRVNRKEEQEPNKERLKHQILGNVNMIMDSPGAVEVQACRIFERGLFKDDSSIILFQGGPGMGKTTLGHSYCKKWKDGKLSKFDMAVFVHLRDTKNVTDVTFNDLLLQACGNDTVMKEELKHKVETGLSLLLVLDGWDEAPYKVRKSPGNFIRMLQRSISSHSKSKILITSRPDSTVNLDVNRVEIVGLSQESIHNYFKEALRTKLDDEHEIEDGCKELENHLEDYPSIQSCCAIPLNAAIVASQFLMKDKKPRSLPRTRHKLLSSIVVYLINKEQEKHHNNAQAVSELKDLPKELKMPLCRLAFDHLNEVVIPHEKVACAQLVELGNIKQPNAFNSAKPVLFPCLRAVLQEVEKRDPKSGKITYFYHFIHLSIQELLAAYHISNLGEDEQVKEFKDLLDKPRFSAVLQFYAAFTRFANQGVRKIVTSDLVTKQRNLLTIMRCCFEAEIQDQSFYQNIILTLNHRLSIAHVVLTPFDCMSVGYFLTFALRTCGELIVELQGCSIDDHSLGLLLAEFSRHAETCQAGVLEGVTQLNISGNDFGDKGVAHLANALETNTTIKALRVSYCSLSSKGAKLLARALVASSCSLEELYIYGNKIGDDGIARIATALRTNNTLKWLVCKNDTLTDKAAFSLLETLTRNTSMKFLWLGWSSAGPDKIFTKMAECVVKSTLSHLVLDMRLPSSGEAPVMMAKRTKVREWYQHVQVGGNEFILSLEDSRFEKFWFKMSLGSSSFNDLETQTYASLKKTSAYVNSERNKKKLQDILFEIPQ